MRQVPMFSLLLPVNHPALRAVVLAAVVTFGWPALGQEVPTSQPTTQPTETAPADQTPTTRATVPEIETVTSIPQRDTIQNQLAQIQSAKDLPETQKTELLSLYRQALEQIGITETLEAKVNELTQGRERAPDLLAETKARIAQATSRPTTQPAPEVGEDVTLEQLTQRLSEFESTTRAAQDTVKKLADEATTRDTRRSAIPDLLADATKRQESITTNLAAAPAPDTPPQIALARRTLLQAQKKAVDTEIREYQEELRYFDARAPVLAARREEARLIAAEAAAKETAWRTLVNQRRQREIDKQREQTEEHLRTASEPMRQLVEENARLADEWEKIGARIKELQDKKKTVTALKDRLDKEHADVLAREKQDPELLTEIIGPELRRKRSELDQFRHYEREVRAIKQESLRVERESDEIDEALVRLTDLNTVVDNTVDEIAQANPGIDVANLRTRVEELYKSRRDLLTKMQGDYHTYVSELREVWTAEIGLDAKINEFRAYVDKHILWLRSTEPIYAMRLPDSLLRRTQDWLALGPPCAADLANNLPIYLAAAIVLAGLFYVRRRIGIAFEHIAERVRRPLTDSFNHTLLALLYTLIASLPTALLLAFLGWRVAAAVDVSEAQGYDAAQAVSGALYHAALLLWTLCLARQLCRVGGMAETHFRWDPTTVRIVRTHLTWLRFVAVPVVVITYAAELHSDDVWRGTLGRLAFIVGMVALALFLHRLLHPAKGILAKRMRRVPDGWLNNLRVLWFPAAVGIPLALAVASALGYHYTAIQLSEDLIRTGWLILVLLIVHGLFVRWLIVAQRRLAIEQAQKRRAAAAAAEQEKGQTAVAEAAPIDEPKLDLLSIGDQTKRILRSMATFALVIGLWVIWSDLLPALQFLNDVELWPYTVTDAVGAATGDGSGAAVTGQHVEYITLAHVALAIVIALATSALARNIPGLLEITILQRMPLDRGGRYAFTTLARYAIVVVGIIVTFGAIGIGWSKVQWLVAAMTVGLGFGLQEIFANFVSGVMLLFERPIRVGDTVTVGDVHGTVTRMRIRATTITDWDRKELVIPNKEFVTGQFINWTLSDTTQRICLPVGIAYGSDIALVERLLLQLARAHRDVLQSPEPYVIFSGFGDSSLNMELRVYVAAVDHLLRTRHDLNKAIDQAFRDNNIEIPFPQRDLHVRSIRAALPLERHRPDEPKLPDDAEPPTD